MADIPLLFSAPMVNAAIDGRKTETRRLAWGKPQMRLSDFDDDIELDNLTMKGWKVSGHDDTGAVIVWPPTRWQKAKAGDLCWVRETWQQPALCDVQYRATDTERIGHWNPEDGPWRPSIFMPRWASRLTFELTAVRIERLLDITEESARAEGFADGILNDGFGPRDIGGGCTIESPGTMASAGGMFQIAWSELHPQWDGYSSPEVVVLTGVFHKMNIDAFKEAA